MKKQKSTKLYEWQQQCANGSEVCAKCGSSKFLTVDHIVPVFILEQFGLDRFEVLYNLNINFQILCRYCNQEKPARLDPRNPKTYEVLEYLITRSKAEAFLK
jgi:hypothetical protein